MMQLYVLILVNLLATNLAAKGKRSEGKENSKQTSTLKSDRKSFKTKGRKASVTEAAEVKQAIQEGQVFDELADTEKEQQRELEKVQKQQAGLTSLFNEFNKDQRSDIK